MTKPSYWYDMIGSSNIGPVTMANVERWVWQLSESDRKMLAKGPLKITSWKTGFHCRCCEVFEPYWVDGVGYSKAVVQYLSEFHTDCHGEDPVASYLRCLLIYLSAGWKGYE